MGNGITNLDISKKDLYEAIWRQMDSILKEWNPCEFQGGRCFRNREKSKKEKNGCCHGCEWLSDKGCTVMSLGCKLFLCQGAHDKLPSYVQLQITKLKRVAKDSGILWFYSTRLKPNWVEVDNTVVITTLKK